MNKEDIIYFSVNNWICGQDYPPIKNIYEWLSDSNSEGFKNNEWCKKNKLCVYWGYIDLSINYTIAASKEWIEKNCPKLLTDEEYTYELEHYDYKTKESVIDTYTKKYSDFVYKSNNNEEPDNDINDMPFPKYSEEAFGSTYYKTSWYDYIDDDEEEENDEEE